MKPGELVAARMSGGIAVARVVEVDASRVRVAVRRKREARLPAERIILSTQIIVSDEEELATFRERAELLAADMDLADLWEVVCDEQTAFTPDDLADLYWGSDADAAQRVALLICVDKDDLHFENGKSGYTPRAPEAVEETLARRRRRAQNAADADALAAALTDGSLPPALTPHQQMLMESVRDYAVFGDDYTRSATVKALLNKMERKMGNLQRLAFETLVAIGEFAPDEPLELRRESIATAFSDEALAAADAITDAALLAEPHRLDLTAAPIVTIDDAGTADKDDALSLERTDEIHNGGAVYRLGVHITDAGALIPPQSALDDEANRRMATLYIPDGAIPMMPNAVSHGKGSLESGELRAALSLLVRISADGEVLEFAVKPSVIRSEAALSYDDADAAIADTARPYNAMLADLQTLTQALKRRREANGAVNIDRPEMQVKVRAPDDIEVRVIERATPARQMVAECMVLCNSLLAAFCRDNAVPAAYRSQPAPDLSDIGADLPPGVDLSDGPLRWHLMMRRFAPADISAAAAPHNGLGVAAYIQATSPLRRYPDMVMQRQISHFLSAGEPLYSDEEIASVAARADAQLRALGKLEAQRKQYWFLKFLKQSISKDADAPHMDAIALENQPRRSALLELADYPFRVRAQLPNAINPGERVELQLSGVDLWARRASFVQIPTA